MNYDLGYLPHCEGAWNNYTAYDPMAIVTNYGTAYISKVAISAGAYEPGVTAGWGNYWQILAEGVQGYQGQRGVQGATGSQGARGYIGDDGAQGSTGAQGAVGAQGAAGSGLGIFPWCIKKEVKQTGTNIIIDKMGGGEYHICESPINSLKFVNAKIGDGETTNLLDSVLNVVPSYVLFTANTNFSMSAYDFPTNLQSEYISYDIAQRFEAGCTYLMMLWGHTVQVTKLKKLVVI